jgi:L-histidine N-alpha-methyltransferase
VHVDDRQDTTELSTIRAGLLRSPPEISPKFFYDDRGSLLFDEICRTPEYYQTRTEADLLADIADQLIELTGAEELVELGSGAALKTPILLDAMARAHKLRLYVPFDVNEMIVRESADRLVARYPGLRVHGVIGEFVHHLDHIPDGGRRLVIFLGGTIGNFEPDAARSFLRGVAAAMGPGDHFLLGVDLIKPAERLEAAYNDAQGITAAFNLNVLEVMNRMLGGDFEPGGFAHRALYEPASHRIEMRLRSLRDQLVTLPALGLAIGFPAGREILTEISVKFDRRLATDLIEAAGLELEGWFTDRDELFGLVLARRR